MNRNINEFSNSKYTLDNAFEIIKSSLGDSYQIINSIILSQKQEYDAIINSMNNDIGILNKQIEQLKEENNQLKGTILQLQNKLITLSHNLRKLSNEDQSDSKKLEMKYSNLKQKHLNKNKEKVDKIKNDIKQNLDNINLVNNNFDNVNNNINNEIFKSNMKTIDISHMKNSINQQIFNKKFNIKKGKTFTKGFNTTYKDTTPTRVIQKDNNLYIKENDSHISIDSENNYNQQQSKTISNINHRRTTYNNFPFKNEIIKDETNQKDKFNIIAKKIRHLKNGLSINNVDNNDSNFRYNTTTFNINRRNYSNINFLDN